MTNYITGLAKDQHWPAEIRVYETHHIEDKEPQKNLIAVVPFASLYGGQGTQENFAENFLAKLGRVAGVLHEEYSDHCDGTISIEIKAEYDFINC